MAHVENKYFAYNMGVTGKGGGWSTQQKTAIMHHKDRKHTGIGVLRGGGQGGLTPPPPPQIGKGVVNSRSQTNKVE